MNLEQIKQSLLNLTLEERRRFLDWFYENESTLAGSDKVHPSVKAEIQRRLDEAQANPEMWEPWTGTIERARQRLHDIRARKS